MYAASHPSVCSCYRWPVSCLSAVCCCCGMLWFPMPCAVICGAGTMTAYGGGPAALGPTIAQPTKLSPGGMTGWTLTPLRWLGPRGVSLVRAGKGWVARSRSRMGFRRPTCLFVQPGSIVASLFVVRGMGTRSPQRRLSLHTRCKAEVSAHIMRVLVRSCRGLARTIDGGRTCSHHGWCNTFAYTRLLCVECGLVVLQCVLLALRGLH